MEYVLWIKGCISIEKVKYGCLYLEYRETCHKNFGCLGQGRCGKNLLWVPQLFRRHDPLSYHLAARPSQMIRFRLDIPSEYTDHCSCVTSRKLVEPSYTRYPTPYTSSIQSSRNHLWRYSTFEKKLPFFSITNCSQMKAHSTIVPNQKHYLNN